MMMTTLCKVSEEMRRHRGAALVYFALTTAVFLGIAALAIDVGYAAVVRNQLQNAADASALGATRRLGSIYESMAYADLQSYDCGSESSCLEVISVAQEAAAANVAGGQNVSVPPAGVTVGEWKNLSFTPADVAPNAVSVVARRDEIAGGPISTFFAGILGRGTVPVSAEATAALTGIPVVGPGGLPIPVGLSENWFDAHREGGFCGRSIRFYPTDLGSCAGWHTFFENANSNHLKAIVDYTKGFVSPPVSVGQSVNFYGSAGGTLFNPGKDYFLDLFNYMRVRNDGVFDRDSDSSTWTASVVVYDKTTTNDCNPSGSIVVKGFATVVITQVLGSNQGKTIVGNVLCDYQESRGGGGDFGTLGTIPGLVR